MAAWALIGAQVILIFAAINFALGLGVLLPFPGIDGEVFWREIRRSGLGKQRTRIDVNNKAASKLPPWPNLVIIAGGLLMVALWPIYTTLHGPTSFNQNGAWLGQQPEFWGAMMEAPASLLIALGLFGHYALLAGGAGRLARIGFGLIMIGLILPALVDLALLAIVPPLLSPLVAIGLFLLAVSHQKKPAFPKLGQLALWGMGGLLLLSFLWALLMPMDVSDQLGGYRIFGVMANLLFGAGWIVLGVSLWKTSQAE